MKKSCLIISLLVMWALLGFGPLGPAPQPSLAQTPAPVQAPAPAVLAPDTFANLAKQVSGAVVNISAEKIVKNQMREMFQEGAKRPKQGPAPEMPFGPDGNFKDFRDFFDKFFGEMPKSYKARSLGSGFIIDAKGYVVTNNHVVEGADKIKIILVGGKEYQATVKGRDPKTDLALIQIVNPPADLAFLKMGDSDAIQVGDWVLAVGNPFGLGHTVTQGIISAKGRVIGAGPYDNFLQTDASINPGNSGGPLLNLKGEVIGINTAILASGQGIGFATPSNIAKSVIPQLESKGKVVRGMIGVQVQNVTPELAKSFGMSEARGALVAEVNPDSPAQKAGIHQGDIIIEFNGHPIHEMNELPRMVASIAPGAKATLKVLRDGKEKTLNLTIVELTDEKQAQAKEEGKAEKTPLGLEVQNLTPALAQQFRLRDNKGVVVVQVESGSPAADANIRAGDLILEVNGTVVGTIKEYMEAVAKVKKDAVARFLVKRAGRTLYLTVENPK
ncbi:MAG: DegQ family serine endoprotease [Deltaproteobacteria bacterium]|nr:DegQ family serine endoprotease [Deltaproteobacteria bacterium]